MATADFKFVELYGGAITVNLPQSFIDVSNIRPVPDHQEIYISSDGFSSIVFDINERVAHLPGDAEALEYHFQDIVTSGETSKIWQSSGVHLAHFVPTTPARTLVASTAPPLPPVSPLAPTSTTIIMTLVRLVSKSTDLVITINLPHIAGQTVTNIPSAGSGPLAGQEKVEEVDFEKGRFGAWVGEGFVLRDEVLRTLEIKDWGLFGEEDSPKREDVRMSEE